MSLHQGRLRGQRHQSAARSGNADKKAGLFAVRDGHVEAQERAEALQLGIIRSREFKAQDFAA